MTTHYMNSFELDQAGKILKKLKIAFVNQIRGVQSFSEFFKNMTIPLVSGIIIFLSDVFI